jgi:uncharacterized membrane protein YfcA
LSWTWKTIGLMGILGLAAGTFSSLLGIGAGVVVVPVLSLLWDKTVDSPQKVAQGTALALMVPMALAGCMRYHFGDEPGDWKLSISIAAYAIVGSVILLAIPLLVAHHIGYTDILGHVNWHTAAMMILGAIIGTIWLGAPLANSLPTETLRKIFGIMTIAVGIRMMGWHTVFLAIFGITPSG